MKRGKSLGLVSRVARVVTSLLMVLALTVPGLKAHATSSWGVVGTAGFSDADVNYPQIAITTNGTPYVVYAEDTGSFTFKLSAKRFNGTSWEQVGSPHFSEGDAGIVVFKISPTNVPYVVYNDGAQSGQLTVERFNGTDWELVGPAGWSGGHPDGTGLAFATDGTPYVAFADDDNGRKPVVYSWDGANWVGVGSAGFSDGNASGLGLAMGSDNVPYASYSDSALHKVVTKRFNGTSWESVGDSSGFSDGSGLPDAESIVMDANNKPYVAYFDNAHSNKATVMHFNGTGWDVVGSPGFSAGLALNTRLALTPTGVPYISYSDDANGDKATVQRFDGTNWQVVGSVGFTPDAAYGPDVAINDLGVPFVAYGDAANDYKLTVQQFVGGDDELPDNHTVTLANAEDGKPVVVTTPFGTALNCHGATRESQLAMPDPGYQYPAGFINYCFGTDLVNNQVSVIFATDLQSGDVVVRKYNSITRTYSTVTGATIVATTIDGQSALQVSYTITDNGAFDSNPTVGAVTDPVGIATAVAAPASGVH